MFLQFASEIGQFSALQSFSWAALRRVCWNATCQSKMQCRGMQKITSKSSYSGILVSFSIFVIYNLTTASHPIGTLLQLDTLRRIPDTAQCVKFALSGDIEGLKYLFEKGLASPRDVSTTRGYSVLQWALYGKQYETCSFLIHAGADADYKPISASDNNPRNKACHFLLEGGLSDTAVDALRTITKGGYLEDFIENAGYRERRIH